MMRSISLILISGLILSLCPPVLAKGDEPLPPSSPEGWVGRNLDELTASWGEPDKVFASADGSRIVIYLSGREVVLAFDPHDSLSRSPHKQTLNSESQFRTDSNGLILEHNGKPKPIDLRFKTLADRAIVLGIAAGTLVFLVLVALVAVAEGLGAAGAGSTR